MDRALFYRGHPTPDTLFTAKGNTKFLKDNPELVRHLEICEHCKKQIDTLRLDMPTRPVLDSSDFEAPNAK
jgi:hypothetical protein